MRESFSLGNAAEVFGSVVGQINLRLARLPHDLQRGHGDFERRRGHRNAENGSSWCPRGQRGRSAIVPSRWLRFGYVN